MERFQAHLELLHIFLTHRAVIADRIQGLLNAQRRPAEYLQDDDVLSREFESCFFTLPGVTPAQARLQGQLEEAHWADGFKPRDIPGLRNGLIAPAEMMIRGFHFWQQTRWPGRNGRLHYAHALFNLYIVRCLTFLTMRIWDAGTGNAAERLRQIQDLLDELWGGTSAGQPVLVRDARWLIQLAQSPATDDLRVYFDVVARIDDTLPAADRLEIHKAGAQMAGGHLRSQLRHYSMKNAVAIDDRQLVLGTRNTNALDFALLIQDLVPLLAAYESAVRNGDVDKRRELSAAICQGLSPDPELFLIRIDLLAAYSMVEHVFVTTDVDGHAGYTPLGRRHMQILHEYQGLIGRAAPSLLDDCRQVTPVAGTYSPYSAIYGFSSDLLGHMTFKVLQGAAVPGFSLEDVFTDGDDGKLAWVSGWRKLPHLSREVAALFDYPQQFAEEIADRIEAVLERRLSRGEAAGVRTGRLFVPSDQANGDANVPALPELPVRYIESSDRQLVAAHNAAFCDEAQLSSDRREGRCLVSYKTAAGWVAISKALLSDVLASGQDVRLAGLPPAAVETLKLMYPGLIVVG